MATIQEKIDVRKHCPKCGNKLRFEHDGVGYVVTCWSGCVTGYDAVAAPKVNGHHDWDDRSRYANPVASLAEVAAAPYRKWSHVEFPVSVFLWWNTRRHGAYLNGDLDLSSVFSLTGVVECHIAVGKENQAFLGACVIHEVQLPWDLTLLPNRDLMTIRALFEEAIKQKTGRRTWGLTRESLTWPWNARHFPLPRD